MQTSKDPVPQQQVLTRTALEKDVELVSQRSPSAGRANEINKNYDHGRTRTCSLLIRSQALYPMAIEPHGHFSLLSFFRFYSGFSAPGRQRRRCDSVG